MARGKTITKEDEKKIRTLANMGMKGPQIADFLGLGRSTVYGIMSGKREEYNEAARKRRTPETAVQMTMETPETPKRLEGDPAHVLMPHGIKLEEMASAIHDGVTDAICDAIKAEKKNAWGLVYSAMLQAIRDAKKGGQQDGGTSEELPGQV